jgi:Ni,Fe-hydrogenase III large subunit
MTKTEHIALTPAALTQAVGDLVRAGGRMQMAYGWQPEPGVTELRYLADRPGRAGLVIWSTRPGDRMPSVTPPSPMMGWYEREITDLYGIVFDGNPQPVPLLRVMDLDESTAPEMAQTDVQRLPFGPVRADVVESVRLDFFYVGEQILHLHPQLFFKHRGMEQRFEGLHPDQGVVLAERVSGVGSFSHALAYCQAIERAADCDVPLRARMLRTILAELERVYNHLHYLGHLADTTTLKVGQAEGLLLEERAKQINGWLTGSRFLRGMLCPGGLRRDLPALNRLAAALEAVREDAAAYVARLDGTGSFLDRLVTTGPLDRQTAFDQGAAGPVERASGLDRDLRRDYPYAAYDRLPPRVPVLEAGDANARFQIRCAELFASTVIVQRALDTLEPGPVRVPCVLPPGAEGLGWCENPRGGCIYAVHADAQGRLARVKIKSPSYSNWRVYPYTVHGSNMMDYAINEASFGMTVAGCDR